MTKVSVTAVLAELLDVIERGERPSKRLVMRGRQSLRKNREKTRNAVRAAAASGRSGRPATRSAEERYRIACIPGSLAEVAAANGIGESTVRRFRIEFPESEKIRVASASE